MKSAILALWAAIIMLMSTLSAAASPVFDAFRSLCGDNRADRAAALQRADANGWVRLPHDQIARLAASTGLKQADGRVLSSGQQRMILMTGIRVQNRGNQAVEHQFCGISASPGGGTDLEHSASRWAAVPPMEQPSAPAGAKVYAFVDHLGHHPIEGSVQTGGAFMLTVIVASGGDAVALEAIPRAHVGSWTAPQLPGEQIVRALPPAPTRAAPRTEPTAPLKMDVLGNRPESYAKEPARVAQQPLSSGPRAIEIAPPQESIGRDQFAGAAENGFRIAREAPVSTFSIDVDTASYSFVRASLNRNVLPQPAAVRTEELVNYFPYAYEAPSSATEPFRTTVAVFPNPVGRRPQARADRDQGLCGAGSDAPARKPRVPDRHLGLDECAQPAAAGKAVAGDAADAARRPVIAWRSSPMRAVPAPRSSRPPRPRRRRFSA